MGIEIIIVSHRRAGSVTTHRHLDDKALVCIPKSQYKAYGEYHVKSSLLVHPDSVKGLSAKRQWIYDKYPNVLMIDDDSTGMLRLYREKGEKVPAKVPANSVRDILETVAETARKLGVYLWGVSNHAHPITFHPGRPFTLGGYHAGGNTGLLQGSSLFFPVDTTLPLEDVWICCLNYFYHRFAFFDHRFAFGFLETFRGAGDNAEYRASGVEEECIKYLRKKFGSVIIQKKHIGAATKRTRSKWMPKVKLPYVCG